MLIEVFNLFEITEEHSFTTQNQFALNLHAW